MFSFFGFLGGFIGSSWVFLFEVVVGRVLAVGFSGR